VAGAGVGRDGEAGIGAGQPLVTAGAVVVVAGWGELGSVGWSGFLCCARGGAAARRGFGRRGKEYFRSRTPRRPRGR